MYLYKLCPTLVDPEDHPADFSPENDSSRNSAGQQNGTNGTVRLDVMTVDNNADQFFLDNQIPTGSINNIPSADHLGVFHMELTVPGKPL